jgi:hypothetical protein
MRDYVIDVVLGALAVAAIIAAFYVLLSADPPASERLSGQPSQDHDHARRDDRVFPEVHWSP